MSGFFANATLRRRDGREVRGSDALKGKVVGVYLANWCGKCIEFVEHLREFYDTVSDRLELVFVYHGPSTDFLKHDYFQKSHGSWLYAPSSDAFIRQLRWKRELIGDYPRLVILDKDGNIVSTDAKNDVRTKAPEKALAEWTEDITRFDPMQRSLSPYDSMQASSCSTYQELCALQNPRQDSFSVRSSMIFLARKRFTPLRSLFDRVIESYRHVPQSRS